MRVQKAPKYIPICDSSFVRVTSAGNITEVMYSKAHSKGGYSLKLSKDFYCDTRSGEVKEFHHQESRADDLKAVSKSLAMGRDLLNANITDVTRCRWLTLTYAENMTDPKKLIKDFENFNSRCRNIFGHYEYITAAEPQARGAWHLHCIFIFDSEAPFMENSIVSDCWKQGFVNVKKLDNVDNVGAYLTAYLGDIELSSCEPGVDPTLIKEIEITSENGTVSKRYVKGARLRMYPPGFHIFRWSKGIKKPIVETMPYHQAKEKISSAKLTFSKTILVDDEESSFSNSLSYEYYNRIRKK